MSHGQTVLGIPHRVMYRDPKYWHRPDDFLPERWLRPDEERNDFTYDRRDGFHPFSYGPRICIAAKYVRLLGGPTWVHGAACHMD